VATVAGLKVETRRSSKSAMERVADDLIALRRNPHNRAIHRYVYQVGDHELTPVQVDILETVVDNPRQRMNELAHALGVDASTVSRTTLPLVELGLIERRQDSGDKRLTIVIPTEKGLAQARVIAQSRREMMYAVQRHISPEKLELFADLVKDYLNAVNTEGARVLQELKIRR